MRISHKLPVCPDRLLYEAIKDWRRYAVEEENVPPYVIFGDRAIEDLILKKPRMVRELLTVFGIGEIKAEKFGSALLRLVENTGGYKHFHVQKNASLTLEGNITLQGAHYGNNAQYALYIEEGGTAESKNNVRITGFKNNYHGTVCTAGTLIMSGGKIDGNKTRYGGGVYVYGGGTFTMKGGTITDNDAVNHGGAVSVSGTFNWEGGSITGNSCSSEIIYTEGSGTVNNPHGYTAS